MKESKDKTPTDILKETLLNAVDDYYVACGCVFNPTQEALAAKLLQTISDIPSKIEKEKMI